MTTQTEAQKLADWLDAHSNSDYSKGVDAAAELRRLESENLDMDRLLMASVPHRWKSCKSPVGAVQSYIAELEAANAELMESLKVCEKTIDRLWVSHHANAADHALDLSRAAIKKHGGK